MPYSNSELKWSLGKQLIVAAMFSHSGPRGCNDSDGLQMTTRICVGSKQCAGGMYKIAVTSDEELPTLKQLIMKTWPSARKLVQI